MLLKNFHDRVINLRLSEASFATSSYKQASILAKKRRIVNKKMIEKENIECKFLISKAGALSLSRRSGTLRRAVGD